MSDKNTYNEDFIDKGWQDMSAILDKEMPVKEKKKRFFLLFFFFGFLSVIALGITFIPMQNSEAIGSEIIANERVGNQLIDVDNNSEEIVDLNEEIIRDNEVDEYEKTAVLKADLNTKEQHNKTLVNTSKNNLNKDAMLRVSILSANNKPAINNKPVITPIINNKLPIKNESLIINPQSLIKEDDELPISNYQFLHPIALDFPLLENDDETEKLPTNFKYKKWRFGIEAGLVFQNENELGGKVGFVATRRMNKKWALHTGMEYNAHFINYAQVESAGAFEVSDQQFDDNGNVIGLGNYEAIYLNNSTKMISHHLKIPILVAYRFHSLFEVNLGIVNDFNIYSRERNRLLSDSSVGVAFPLSTIAASKIIKPFYDPQASLGLTYYPTKKWGISLRYDYGFMRKEITATIPESDYQAASKSSAGITGYGSHYRLLNLSAKVYF